MILAHSQKDDPIHAFLGLFNCRIKDHRGEGHGSKLMTAIEKYGIEHGYPLVYLETASFQALPFYEGLGYRVFGELPEITPGHTLFFLKKELL